MSKIVDTVVSAGPGSADEARKNLRICSARFVDEALADHPDGPVHSVITRHGTGIDYEVVVGDLDASGGSNGGRVIWSRGVTFGMDDRHVAGGAAFVEIAREQDAVSFWMFTLLESKR
jgi:hypothetical protein